ncbi:MAG: indolepyruvate oxidoreductase subunit beta [Zestosphaera sp.]
MSSTLNILISGVGGQGLLTLARILGQAALNEGHKVYIAETHGMSQRGGSVTVFMRVGDDVMAPLPPEDDVNLHISMELIEAVRYSTMHSVNTVAIVNNKVIRPSLPGVKMPSVEELVNMLRGSTRNLYLVDASDISMGLGSTVGANVVMLGFATYLLEKSSIVRRESAINEVLKLGARELNVKLFEAGYLDASKKVGEESLKHLSEVFRKG